MRAFVYLLVLIVSVSGACKTRGHSESLLAVDGDVVPINHYYMVLFAYQGLLLPGKSHSFVQFFQPAIDANQQIVGGRGFSISFLPARFNEDRHLSVFDGSEPGKNFTLEETLDFSEFTRGGNVVRWGPIEINEEFFNRAWAWRQRLDTGAFRYKVVDQTTNAPLIRWLSGQPTGGTLNCIHAASGADGALMGAGRLFGIPASEQILAHYVRNIDADLGPDRNFINYSHLKEGLARIFPIRERYRGRDTGRLFYLSQIPHFTRNGIPVAPRKEINGPGFYDVTLTVDESIPK